MPAEAIAAELQGGPPAPQVPSSATGSEIHVHSEAGAGRMKDDVYANSKLRSGECIALAPLHVQCAVQLQRHLKHSSSPCSTVHL